ncbi:helix-turn-helix domain-containing protein [Actinomadura roseirufa]|uniref:helix-turn-helix domain-containing protein n=1 Tax=Actinomadura roseirufa TaxID=2094049 RepID=UPI00104113BA|nr:helix-turn-helix domain-containing protein [Actinomadura roseirufa]
MTTAKTDGAVQPLLWKPEEAAVLLGIGRTKVYDLMRSGALRSVRFGGNRRIPATALTEFVAQLEEKADAA